MKQVDDTHLSAQINYMGLGEGAERSRGVTEEMEKNPKGVRRRYWRGAGAGNEGWWEDGVGGLCLGEGWGLVMKGSDAKLLWIRCS